MLIQDQQKMSIREDMSYLANHVDHVCYQGISTRDDPRRTGEISCWRWGWGLNPTLVWDIPSLLGQGSVGPPHRGSIQVQALHRPTGHDSTQSSFQLEKELPVSDTHTHTHTHTHSLTHTHTPHTHTHTHRETHTHTLSHTHTFSHTHTHTHIHTLIILVRGADSALSCNHITLCAV